MSGFGADNVNSLPIKLFSVYVCVFYPSADAIFIPHSILGYYQFPAGMHSPPRARDQPVLPDKHHYFKSCRGRMSDNCTEDHARLVGPSVSS